MASTTQGFDEFYKDIDKLLGNSTEKSLAERLLKSAGKQIGASLGRNTPVYEGYRDDYPTGQLKAGWFGNQRNANINDYVNNMPVTRAGTSLEIKFENKVQNTSLQEFGSYVDEGHGQEVGRYVGHNDVNARLVRPFIEGLNFVEKSVNETEMILEAALDRDAQIELNKDVR